MTIVDELVARTHRALGTTTALKAKLDEFEFPPIDYRVIHPESMFYCQNLMFNLAMSESRDGGLVACDKIGNVIYNLIETRLLPGSQTFNVLKLDGLTASKSSGYRSLDEFAGGLYMPHEYYDTIKLIRFETDDDFRYNIARFESDFGVDGLIYFREWDGKYFVANSGGSHHLAAVYRQCKVQGRHYDIKCRIESHSINHDNCRLLLDRYYPLVVDNGCKNNLSALLRDFGMNCRTVRLLDSCGLIYLPKEHSRSEFVYKYLTGSVGAQFIFDLYNYLEALLAVRRD